MLVVGILNSPEIYAQVGWEWGVGSHGGGVVSYDLVSMVGDKFGNVISTGYVIGNDSIVIGSTVIHPDPVVSKTVITKTDSSGHFLWSITSLNSNNSFPIGVVTDAVGNIYLYGNYYAGTFTIGAFTLTSTSDMYYLAKVSPIGNVLWVANVCVNGSLDTLGGVTGYGAGAHYGSGYLGIDALGYVYISGSFNHRSVNIGTTTLFNTDTTGITSDFFLAKYDTLGLPIWAAKFGGISGEVGNAMAVTKDGYIYISCSSNSDSIMLGLSVIRSSSTSFTGGFKYINFLSKFDASGHLVWAKKLNYHIGVMGMVVDVFDNYYISGYFDSSIILGTDTLTCSLGTFSYLITKFDSSGTPIWVNTASPIRSPNGIGENSMAIDTCGNVWVCAGGNSLTIEGHLLSTSVSGSDFMFIAEFDRDGHYQQGMVLPGGGDDWSAIVGDSKGSFYVGGDYFLAGMTFGSYTLPYSSYEELFIAKYRYDTIGCPSLATLNYQQTFIPQKYVEIYPNPTHQNFTIENAAHQTLAIYDVLGKQVLQTAIDTDVQEVRVGSLTPGMYFVHITNAATGSRKTFKLMKE
jgi:Secretion system C-terminal sorting domain